MNGTSWIEKALAAVLARVIWFVVVYVFLFLYLLYAGEEVFGPMLFLGSPAPVFLFVAIIAGAVAIVGPWVLSATRNRGSGKLAEIKAMSATPEEEERKINIPVASPRR